MLVGNSLNKKGAVKTVDGSTDGPSGSIQANILDVYALLEAMREYWSPLDDEDKFFFRFHHDVSADEVYGDLEGMDDLFLETTSYEPGSPYCASKMSPDHLVGAGHCNYGLPFIITNCPYNYGAYQFPGKLIPHMILNAVSGKSLPIYGEGLQIRDWLHVEDHTIALVNVALDAKAGQTHNIDGNNEVGYIDVVRTLCGLLEESVPNKPEGFERYEDCSGYVKDRAGHDVRSAIDASKIESKFGWTPRETFEIVLRKTIECYLSNRTWWQRVLDDDYRLGRLGEEPK